MTSPDHTCMRRRFRRLLVWVIALVVVGVPIYIGWTIKRAVDLSILQSSGIVGAHHAGIFLAAELDAGHPLPASEADFVVAFKQYLEAEGSGWPVEQSVAEGWTRYRPPAPGEPLQADPCADDFVLWSEHVDCDTIRQYAGNLIWAIEQAAARSSTPDD